MLAAIAAVAVTVLLPAHASVIGSTPEDGSTLTEQPGTLSVVLNEAIVDVPGAESGNVLEITDAAGFFYGDGCATVDGDTISLDAQLGAAGDYTLAYQVVSSDGHPVSGEVAFAFEPVDAVGGPDGASAAPVCDEAAPAATTESTAAAAPSTASAEPVATPSSSGEVAAPQTTATGPDEPESTDAPGVDPGTDAFGALPAVAVFVLAALAALAFIAYRVNRNRKDRRGA